VGVRLPEVWQSLIGDHRQGGGSASHWLMLEMAVAAAFGELIGVIVPSANRTKLCSPPAGSKYSRTMLFFVLMPVTRVLTLPVGSNSVNLPPVVRR